MTIPEVIQQLERPRRSHQKIKVLTRAGKLVSANLAKVAIMFPTEINTIDIPLDLDEEAGGAFATDGKLCEQCRELIEQSAMGALLVDVSFWKVHNTKIYIDALQKWQDTVAPHYTFPITVH